MIIYNLDLRWPGSALRPLEANPPLGIDADAVLAAPVAAKRLQTVARQAAQIVEARRGLQNFKALPRLPVEALKLPDERAIGEGLGPFVAEAQNHMVKIAGFDDLRQPYILALYQAVLGVAMNPSHRSLALTRGLRGDPLSQLSR